MNQIPPELRRIILNYCDNKTYLNLIQSSSFFKVYTEDDLDNRFYYSLLEYSNNPDYFNFYFYYNSPLYEGPPIRVFEYKDGRGRYENIMGDQNLRYRYRHFNGFIEWFHNKLRLALQDLLKSNCNLDLDRDSDYLVYKIINSKGHIKSLFQFLDNFKKNISNNEEYVDLLEIYQFYETYYFAPRPIETNAVAILCRMYRHRDSSNPRFDFYPRFNNYIIRPVAKYYRRNILPIKSRKRKRVHTE